MNTSGLGISRSTREGNQTGVLKKIAKVETRRGNFAEWLQETRKILGLTQAELAFMLGYHITAVQRWETGAFMPRPGCLKKLSGFLQQQIDSTVKQSRVDLSRYPKDNLTPAAQGQITIITKEAEELSHKIKNKGLSARLLARLIQNKLLYLSFVRNLNAGAVL